MNEESELVEKANSNQVLLDYIRGNISFAKPYDPKVALSVVRGDPVVAAAIDRKTNKALEGGWGVSTKKEGLSKVLQEKFRRKYRFEKTLRSILRTLQWQDVLLEIVKKDGEVTDINLLDPAAIEVSTKPNGDLEYYYQLIPHGDKKSLIKWTPEKVVHIKYKDAILNYWGESDLRVAYETVMIKDYVRKFLLWLFETNQFRTHYNVAKATEKQIRDFISRLREGEKSYDKPVITEGEMTASPLRQVSDFNQIVGLMEWCDKQLISLLQTTVVAMGWGGSGGRSEGDSLGDDLRTSILSMQKVVSEAINYELLPKMGYGRNENFYWMPLDRMSKKQLLETVEIMRRSGWSDEAIQEFCQREGLSFVVKKWFREPEEGEAPMSSAAKKDGSFSRKRSSEGEADHNVGTGSESTTREDQLVKKSSYDDYPYVYERFD